jgi:hypothetical protein
MEKKFYTDNNFEQFLKDTTDDFRMYPSKRVWNSLYNNLHPGKKWPSLAVCLLLVSSMIYIGVSHKNEIAGARKPADIMLASQTPASLNNQEQKVSADPLLPGTVETVSPGDLIDLHSAATRHAQTNQIRRQRSSPVNNKTAGTDRSTTTVSNTRNQNEEVLTISIENMARPETPGEAINDPAGIPGVNNAYDHTNKEIVTANIPVTTTITGIEKVSGIAVSEINKPPVKKSPAAKNNLSPPDKEWIEDYAFHNKPKEKWRGRLAYQFYATPSIGYRNLNMTMDNNAVLPPSLLANNSGSSRTADVNSSLNHYPSLNLEAGYSLVYSFSKTIRLKAGLQLNYTNYKIHAYQLNHTTSTTLLLADPNTGAPELVQRSSSFANTPYEDANKNLNSNTYQLSVPLGVDIKLAGKNRLQWHAGATIQPTFVAGGNGYLISADLKNYVYDASFLRKWNMNAAIETFFTYRIKNGITLNAGPQVRYQLFSTYKNNYSFDEKLYNLGLKMGITRNF